MFALKNLKPPSRDELFDILGLERKPTRARSFAWAATVLGAGAVIGAGVALLVAPRSGREFRRGVRAKLGRSQGEPAHLPHGDGVVTAQHHKERAEQKE